MLRLLALLGSLIALTVTASSAFADDDYAIPDGWFYSQALPNRDDGAGFAVQDGHGARLFSVFQSLGGVDAFGYPTSRRFEWDGRIAQAFQKTILRWDPDKNGIETMSVAALPGKQIPAYAREPDYPPNAAAEVEPRPWSGWWWPASDAVGPTLFAPNSPLDKYDRYVQAVTGANPATRAWEREMVYFPGSQWAGHCNGFAAAALLEPEPTEPVDVLGINFSVADLKGLLVDYHFGDAAAWTFGQDGELSPADFHRMLLDWVGSAGKGFVLTYDMGGGEVWSYPVYRFESSWSMDPIEVGLWHVKTTVWMADMDVPAGFIGTKPYPSAAGKTFEYTLRDDPRHPSGGAWTGASQSGRFAHPGRIWYPEPTVRNDERDLVSPALDRQTVANIEAGSDGTASGTSPELTRSRS